MSSSRVILWSPIPDDLEAIVDYLAERSPDAATRFITRIEATLDDLAAMPGKGSPNHFRDRLLAGVRSWIVPGFRNYLILSSDRRRN